MTNRFLAILRLIGFLLLTLVCVPIQLVFMAVWPAMARQFPHQYHRWVCRLLGLEVRVKGCLSPTRPTLFVSNHVSYLDIIVLGGALPGSFISKADVKSWPLFGFLSKLQRTVYIDRNPRQARDHKTEIDRRLAAGDSMILFPEGTSSDGNRTLPFKSALFSVAEKQVDGQPLMVQPVSMAYTHLDGLPLGFHLRPYCSWFGDMGLGPHLLDFSGLGQVRVEIILHDPVTIDQFKNRKQMAKYCQSAVQAGVVASLTGRRMKSKGDSQSNSGALDPLAAKA